MKFHFFPFLSSHFPAPGHASTWLVTKHLLLVMLSRHILLHDGDICGCCFSPCAICRGQQYRPTWLRLTSGQGTEIYLKCEWQDVADLGLLRWGGIAITKRLYCV